MKIYLVDFENVKSKGLDGIDNLKETDSVIIFFSENSDTLSFEMHQKVLCSKADIEYFKVCVGGKNALDFQLSTLLGFMVAKETYSHIFVISNDKGFDFLHSFWGGNYIDTPSTLVYRTRTITAAIEFEKKLNEQGADIAEPEETADEAPVQQETEPQASEQEESTVCETVEPIGKIEPAEISEPKKKRTSSRKAMSFDENFNQLLSGICKKDQYPKIKALMIESSTKEEFHNSLAKIYKQQGTDIYKALKTKYLRLKEKYALENPSAELDGQTDDTIPETAAEPETVIEIKTSDKLTELLDGICNSDDEIDRIRKCIGSTKNKRQFYLSMVKEFQMKKGCEYYNAVKSQYNELSKNGQES